MKMYVEKFNASMFGFSSKKTEMDKIKITPFPNKAFLMT